jgi:hypothetical protein
MYHKAKNPHHISTSVVQLNTMRMELGLWTKDGPTEVKSPIMEVTLRIHLHRLHPSLQQAQELLRKLQSGEVKLMGWRLQQPIHLEWSRRRYLRYCMDNERGHKKGMHTYFEKKHYFDVLVLSLFSVINQKKILSLYLIKDLEEIYYSTSNVW